MKLKTSKQIKLLLQFFKLDNIQYWYIILIIISLNLISENKEKLILYWALSISGGLLSVLVIVIGRLLWQRHKTSSNVGNTTLPSFVDDLSEIDNDIDLTPPATNTILPSSLPPGEVGILLFYTVDMYNIFYSKFKVYKLVIRDYTLDKFENFEVVVK